LENNVENSNFAPNFSKQAKNRLKKVKETEQINPQKALLFRRKALLISQKALLILPKEQPNEQHQ